MRTTSLLRAIPRSFYSKELYQEVGRAWPGLGFGYLLTAISIIALPFIVIAMLYSTTITLDEPFDANYIINQIPEMNIKNGEISTQVTMPYYIKDKKAGQTVAIIDTTRSVIDWSQQMKDHKVLVIVGKKQVLLNKKPEEGERTLYDIPENTNMVVNGNTAREFATKILGYGWIVILIIAPFMILTWFIFRIVVMFLYGIFAKVISVVSRGSLSYIDCVRLASVATTPTLVLLSADIILSLNLSGWTYFAVNAVYLFFAVRVNKEHGF